MTQGTKVGPAQHYRTRPLVVVVDAQDDERELYVEGLSALGFDTVGIEDGRRAYEHARVLRPDIIVTEARLPRHDGWQLIGTLKNDALTSGIPVVMLTGNGLSERSLRDRAEEAGCAALLVKPCLPDALARVLRPLVEAKRNGTAIHSSGDGTTTKPASLGSAELFWSKRGAVACATHAPLRDSSDWRANGWQPVPAWRLTFRGMILHCQFCHGRPYLHQTRDINLVESD